MAKIVFQQHASYPTPIKMMRALIVWATMIFAAWFHFSMSGAFSLFPSCLLLSPTVGWPWLWQPLTSALIIPYPDLGLQLVFDLLIINFFLTPIVCFVLSFLTEKHFFRFLFGLVIVGACTFVGSASIFGQALTPPCSLFSGLAMALVIFWALLHQKGQSTLFLAFPVSRVVVLAITAIAALYSPIAGREWAHVCAILSMGFGSYLWGIGRWRLRSYAPSLEPFERLIDTTFGTCSRFVQWYLIRPFRK